MRGKLNLGGGKIYQKETKESGGDVRSRKEKRAKSLKLKEEKAKTHIRRDDYRENSTKNEKRK